MALRKIIWELQFQLKIVIDFNDVEGEITTALTVEGRKGLYSRRSGEMWSINNFRSLFRTKHYSSAQPTS